VFSFFAGKKILRFFQFLKKKKKQQEEEEEEKNIKMHCKMRDDLQHVPAGKCRHLFFSAFASFACAWVACFAATVTHTTDG
jgi:hypothetical protein